MSGAEASAGLVLRPAHAGDAEALARLLAEGDAQHADWYPHLFRQDLRRSLTDFMQEQSLIVAVSEDDSLVGTIAYQFSRPSLDSVFVQSRQLLIDNLIVDQRCRRRGIGRRLVEAVLAEARAAGVAEVRLKVYELNTPARKLYESMGFAPLLTQLELRL